MPEMFMAAAFFLMANFLVGLVRILRGPSHLDRMLAAQLLGSLGIAVVVVLSAGMEVDGLLDVALVFAVLAALAAVFFVRRYAEPGRDR